MTTLPNKVISKLLNYLFDYLCLFN